MPLERIEMLHVPPQELLFYDALTLSILSERQVSASLIGGNRTWVLYHEPAKILVRFPNGEIKGAVPDFFLTQTSNVYDGNPVAFFTWGVFIEATRQRSEDGFTQRKERQIQVLGESGFDVQIYDGAKIDVLMSTAVKTAVPRLQRAAHRQLVIEGKNYRQ